MSQKISTLRHGHGRRSAYVSALSDQVFYSHILCQKISWFKLTDLPTWKRNKAVPGKFYLITPFIGYALQFFLFYFFNKLMAATAR